jgi:hypothetical protein
MGGQTHAAHNKMTLSRPVQASSASGSFTINFFYSLVLASVLDSGKTTGSRG